MKRIASQFWLAAVLVGAAGAQVPVALGGIVAEDHPIPNGFGGSSWMLAGDGLSVTQTANGPPSFFPLPYAAIGSPAEVVVTAPYSSDGDFIGFALGYSAGEAAASSAAYVIVDWKRTTETFDFGAVPLGGANCVPGGSAPIGLSASLVTGVPWADEMWQHENLVSPPCATSADGVTELARATTLGNAGWLPGRTYVFTFVYSSTLLQVFVDGALEISVVGQFPAGGIAFYSFSQIGATFALRLPPPPPPPPPYLDLSVVPGSLSANPSGPAVGQATLLSATVQNLGNASASATGYFYLGDPTLPPQPGIPAAVFLGGSTASFGNSTIRTFSTNWTPTTAGSASVFFVVTPVGTATPDVATNNNRASFSVPVGAAPVNLRVDAADLVAWPGAVLETIVIVTNLGAGPVTLGGLCTDTPCDAASACVPGTTPYAALPCAALQSIAGLSQLPPGGSVSLQATIEVPTLTPGGPLGGAPIPYTVGLSVTDSPFTSVWSGDLVVNVWSAPISTMTVVVRDAGSLAPLSGATVAFSSLPGTYAANGAGAVTLNVPPGSLGVFAYKSGYISSAANYEAPAGGTAVVYVDLQPGQTLSVQSVVSQPLSTPEVIARGIDPTVLVNNVVYDFVLTLTVGTVIAPSVPLPIAPQPGSSVTVSVPLVLPEYVPPQIGGVGGGPPSGPPPTGLGGGGGGGGSPAIATVTISYPTTTASTYIERTETWIIIPGSVTTLKQFFEATIFVQNVANATPNTTVQLTNTSVSLVVPPGLALPDLDGQPQPVTKNLGTLNAGEGATGVWVLRGDVPGLYDVVGSATADLTAFGNFVETITAAAISPKFEVVTPDLRIGFLADTSPLSVGTVFPIGVTVTNQQVAVAQYVRVRIHVDQLVNCTIAPVQPTTSPPNTPGGAPQTVDVGPNYVEVNLGDIDPGSTKVAWFNFTSSINGTVLSVDETVSSEVTVGPPVQVVQIYPGTGGTSLRMRSGVDNPVNEVPLKLVSGGSTLTLALDTSDSNLLNGTVYLAAYIFPTGAPPTLIPGIHIFDGNFASTIILVDGAFGPLAPITLPATGYSTSYFVGPGGIPGLSVMAQFVVAALSSGDLFFSDAHEVRFKQ